MTARRTLTACLVAPLTVAAVTLAPLFEEPARAADAKCSPCAGVPFQSWITPERLSMIAFAGTAAGIAFESGPYFLVDARTLKLTRLGEKEFAARFGTRRFFKKGDDGALRIRPSGGTEFVAKPAYCGEGSENAGSLIEEGAPVTTDIDRCLSVEAVETAPGHLWLGTQNDTEWGAAPTDGIRVVDASTHRTVATIDQKHGASGNLVYLLRRNPRTGEVWAATIQGTGEDWDGTYGGLTVVGANLKVRAARYFAEKLDPIDGTPTIETVAVPLGPDPLVVLARKYKFRDTKGFASAAAKLPASVHCAFCPSARGLLPKEANPMAPFFLERAGKGTSDRERNVLEDLCRFQDDRVMSFLVGLAPTDPYVQMCLKDSHPGIQANSIMDSALPLLNAPHASASPIPGESAFVAARMALADGNLSSAEASAERAAAVQPPQPAAFDLLEAIYEGRGETAKLSALRVRRTKLKLPSPMARPDAARHAQYSVKTGDIRYVSATKLLVKATPDLTGRTAAELAIGAKVEVLETENAWLLLHPDEPHGVGPDAKVPDRDAVWLLVRWAATSGVAGAHVPNEGWVRERFLEREPITKKKLLQEAAELERLADDEGLEIEELYRSKNLAEAVRKVERAAALEPEAEVLRHLLRVSIYARQWTVAVIAAIQLEHAPEPPDMGITPPNKTEDDSLKR